MGKRLGKYPVKARSYGISKKHMARRRNVLNSRSAPLLATNADDVIEFVEKDFAIADLAGSRQW